MMIEVISEDLKYVRIHGTKQKNTFSYTNQNYFDNESEIIISEKAGQYTIKAVGEYAFRGCKAKITLPESVTDIEDYAFENYLYDGYDFQLPSKVQYIGKYAFMFAHTKRVGLNANLKNILDYAFNGSNIEELVIPKSVGNIGYAITSKCLNLKRLEVESGCKNFYTPSGSNVSLEKDLGASGVPSKTILAGCKTSRIPEETFRIAREAFLGVNFTNPTVTIPENVGLIAQEAFESSNIKRLIIRGETVEIQEMAFYDCSVLERIDIYGGNVTIGRSAFEYCTGLFALWCYSHKPKITPAARQFYNIGPNFEYGNSKVKLVAKYPDEYTDRFENIWGKETDLIWQNWFETPFLYTDNYEYMRISEVHITDFDWPVAGQDADYTATSLTPYATVSNIKYQMYLGGWKDIDPSPATLGETYSIGFTITLGNAPHGQCEFTDDVKLYIDDREADLRITSSATETQMTFVVDNYVVPAPPGGVPIKKAYLSVAEPVEGQPLSNTVTNPTGKKYNLLGYTIDNVTWGCVADASLDSYDPTKGYTLAAILTAKQDYCFGADCNFTLNGKTASVIRTHTAEGRERVMLAVGFGDEEPAPDNNNYITDVNIQIPELIDGEPLPEEVLSPTSREQEALSYTISPISWRIGEDYDEGKYVKDKLNVFEILLKVKDDITFFAPDGTYIVNGDTLKTEGEKAYVLEKGNTRLRVVYTVDPVTTLKGDVDGDGSINSADIVAIYNYILIGEESGIKKEDADVDGNGEVNSADIVAVYNIIIGGE